MNVLGFSPVPPPLQLSFDVRGCSLVHPRRLGNESATEGRCAALSYHGHFVGFTVAPKLFEYNPASPRRSHE